MPDPITSGIQHPFTTTSTTSSQIIYSANPGSNPYGLLEYSELPSVDPNSPSPISYPFASSTATSTLNTLTVATSTPYSVYTPFSGYSYDTRGTITTYLTLNGQLVGTYSYEESNPSNAKLTYVFSNYLGTPVIQTDKEGDIVEMDIMDVFGNYVHRDRRNDSAEHVKGYTGHEFDDVTELTYAHARYLMTTAHTFLSVDPMLYKLPESYLIDPQQMNSYAYARNNPIIYTDPTGELAFIPLIIGAMSVINFFIQSTEVAKAPSNQAQAQGTSQIDLNLNRTKAASNYATIAVTFGAGAVGIASSLKSTGTKTAGSTASTATNNSLSGKNGTSVSSGGVGLPKYGDTVQFGNASGVRIEAPKNVTIKSYGDVHAPQRMGSRGVNETQINQSISDPIMVLQQNNKQVFFGREATTVLDRSNGRVVSVWDYERNADNVKQILDNLIQ